MLELVELEERTDTGSSILHMTCDRCIAETGDIFGFCGMLLSDESVLVENPSPPAKCSMCMAVVAELPPKKCPAMHDMIGTR